MIIETRQRTLFKSITWRITATLTTVTLVYLFTGQIDTALEVGVLEVTLKLFIYYLHERLWSRSSFGRIEKPAFVILFTGYSNSGKTRISEAVYQALEERKIKVEYLNGRRIRSLMPNVGFDPDARRAHLGQISDFIHILYRNNTNVIVSMEAPFADSRAAMRERFPNFIEIWVKTSFEFCQTQDQSGLIARAVNGDIQHFVGVDIPFEEPDSAELVLTPETDGIETSVEACMTYLTNEKII